MIGIVGGVGPYAGTDLLNKIYNNTLAHTDQEHLNTALLSMSSKIADRTEFLLGHVKENPAFAIVEVLLKLEKIGVTFAGIPCNTMHAGPIFETIQIMLQQAQSRIKVLHMIDETVAFITGHYPKFKKIGVLSTTGTYKSKLYVSALSLKGYEVVVPPLDMQENFIHPAVYHKTYGIKTVSNPIHPQAIANLNRGISFFKAEGAEMVILGCTEIPLAFTTPTVDGMVVIDPTNILARALIHKTQPNKLKPYIKVRTVL